MRALTTRLVVGLCLLAGARAAAAENWTAFAEHGIEMEVDLDSLSGGGATFRMAKDGLERTLGRFATRAAAMDHQVKDVDLPAEVTGAPGRLFAEAATLARGMGDSLRISSPPTTGTTIDTFKFHDGARHVSFDLSDPASTSLAPMATLTISKRVDGKWVVERQTYAQFDVDDRVSYNVNRGGADGRSVPEIQRTYHPMKRRGQWFAIEWNGRRATYALRTRDQRSGRLTTAPVRGAEAQRLYALATRRAYRTALPSSHPDFKPGMRTHDDLPVEALRRAGVHVVVDPSGKVRLRRSPKGVDRAALHQRGVTYVSPSGTRAAHLRHRPINARAR